MAPTRINGLPRREGEFPLYRLYDLLVTKPSGFYQSGGMSRILERALKTILGDKWLEPENLYEALRSSERRAVKRFDISEQTSQMLAQILKAPTLEGYLRSTTDVAESIRRISEIVLNKQNQLFNTQIELLERLKPSYRGLESRNTDELDRIIQDEERRIKSIIVEPSGLTRYVPQAIRRLLGDERYIQIQDKDRFNIQRLEHKMFDGRLRHNSEEEAPGTIPNEALGIILKYQEVSDYHETRDSHQKAVKNANLVLSGLERLANQSTFREIASRGISLLSERFRELAVKYGPTVLGTAALAAGGFVLYQASSIQIDAFQTQINLLNEQYTNVLNARGLAYDTLQSAKESMANFKEVVREYSVVDKGQGLWNIVKGILTELNPGSIVSNQNIADAVAKVSEANGMLTPAEWAVRFPQHAYPHGDYLAKIVENPNLVYPGQQIGLESITQSSEDLFQKNVQTAQSAYDAALETANKLKSQMSFLKISAESPGLIGRIIQQIDYRFSFSNPLKDLSAVVAAVSSPVFLGLGAIMSSYKEDGLFHNNIIPRLRAYFA